MQQLLHILSASRVEEAVLRALQKLLAQVSDYSKSEMGDRVMPSLGTQSGEPLGPLISGLE